MPGKSPKRPHARTREHDRVRLERAAELYLDACYRARTAARTDEFASYLRVARPYLSRITQERIGSPLRTFLRQQQLVHAKRLLATTPLSVEEIALASAFGTPWTFYRCFKSAFGMTPAEYRCQVTKWPLRYHRWVGCKSSLPAIR
jgi:AraC-like DNA-binding protein